MRLKLENRYKLLFFVVLSYILINLFYISGFIHLGYHFIGIMELLQLLVLVVLLIIEVKNIIKLRKIKWKNTIAILILVISAITIGYSVIVWYFFIP